MTTIAYENRLGDVIKIGNIGDIVNNVGVYNYFSKFESTLCDEHRESIVLTNEETVGIECLNDDELIAYKSIKIAWINY
jgi:phosphopentomutase